ncbi:MAG TPA: SHOCT domain-containing protein [Hanamia sp.]|nr:SHOCT domain-containing protein [Hanamia sp.]
MGNRLKVGLRCPQPWIFATPWGYRRTRDSSYDILRKRFAAGEITKEEYQEAKKVLEEKFKKNSDDNKG